MNSNYLVVGGGRVVAAVAVQIIEGDGAAGVGHAGHVDDAAGRAAFQPVQQQVCQQKVAHVVDAQLRLDALGRHTPRTPGHRKKNSIKKTARVVYNPGKAGLLVLRLFGFE